MDQLLALLLSLLISATGISRTVDPFLVDTANRRVQEIQQPGNFNHSGNLCCWEVLQFNALGIERTVAAWRESPSHWAVLTDPTLTRIGCAVDFDGTYYWAACELLRGTPSEAPTPPEGSQDTTPTVQAPYKPSGDLPEALPDTAMERHG
jgi:hypothetical protein